MTRMKLIFADFLAVLTQGSQSFFHKVRKGLLCVLCVFFAPFVVKNPRKSALSAPSAFKKK
jgi:hypothetical protein